MSINKKIKNDNFIDLDYNRIKDQVEENIGCKQINKKYMFFSNKYIKLGIVTILVVFIGLFTIISLSGNSNQFLKVAAATKQEINYSDNKIIFSNGSFGYLLSNRNKRSLKEYVANY